MPTTSRQFTTLGTPGHASFLQVKRSKGRFVVEIGYQPIPGLVRAKTNSLTTLSDAEAKELVQYLTSKGI